MEDAPLDQCSPPSPEIYLNTDVCFLDEVLQ